MAQQKPPTRPRTTPRIFSQGLSFRTPQHTGSEAKMMVKTVMMAPTMVPMRSFFLKLSSSSGPQ
eukprot:14898668-Alexandrium_andersonii.AAC.1